MSEKLTVEHLARKAYVYVRQSSPHQVRVHGESGRRQYALADRARQLGFAGVVLIDDDQGKSGRGLVDRPGFGQLLTAVCQHEAGAVLALEASRLARNNRDWHHLLDLCAMTATLIIDDRGIYDPRDANDRLLLGLQGTMSEFELSLFRQRAREAFEAKVQRGHALWEVPVGFVRNEEDRLEQIPDRRVQEAVAGVFHKFRELGSARQTMLWYRDENIHLPQVVSGARPRSDLDLADRKPHPPDADQPDLRRRVGLWSHDGSDGPRTGPCPAGWAEAKTTLRVEGTHPRQPRRVH